MHNVKQRKILATDKADAINDRVNWEMLQRDSTYLLKFNDVVYASLSCKVNADAC